MRYKELDGLRGIAALSVYFSHLLGIYTFKFNYFEIISNSPLHIFWHGEAAVSLFFLLSGFVLTLPYINSTNKKLNLLSFYLKRVFRIYPAFILAIIFSILIKELFFKPESMYVYSVWINEFWKWDITKISFLQFFNTFLLVGLPFDTKLFIPVISTLRTEMIISFILPFLIFLALRFKVILNLSVLVLLFVFGKDTTGIFYLGILIAFYNTQISQFVKQNQLVKYTILIFLFAAVLYTSRFSLSTIISTNPKETLLLSVIGCALFLIISMHFDFFNSFLKTKFIQFLGRISYSLYLFHFPVLLITCSISSEYFNSNSILIIFIFSISVTMIISTFVYKYVEIPIIELGRGFANKIKS